MSHLRVWKGRDGNVYFAGKVAVETDLPDSYFGVARPAAAALQAGWLKAAFTVAAMREEAQKHESHRNRPQRG